jgi:hypothetical protein
MIFENRQHFSKVLLLFSSLNLYFCTKKAMVQFLEITTQLLNLFEKTPPEALQLLHAELLKMMPTEKTQVTFKIGSGTFPKENERSIGIFIQVPHSKPSEEALSLNKTLQLILRQASPQYLDYLKGFLDSLEKEALSPFGLTFTPATIILQDMGCIHFSLAGKIAKKNGR